MAVIRTSKVALPVNGNGAYAYVAQPDDDQTHPGLVMIQEWWGIEPHVVDLAHKLAEQGFIVAVPDLFHGKVATEPNDAERMMMMVTSNVERAIQEIIGALNRLKEMPMVEPKRLGVMGFCMGGFLAMKVASRYPELGGVVAFYAAGFEPTPEEAQALNAPVLAIYGSQDSWAPPEVIEKVERMYREAGKDVTVKVYNAGHAFINPSHGAYNEEAASQAWPLAIQFLKDHLK
ncbi:MAG TPA: dienelactone hydrolase family protein [Ktedonobacteraceae bacterium]|nr:dienelactone hydrolase family protein [Ktedonobacteraceae bacterium]